MPYKADEKIRKCKYCNNPAAKNIQPSGRNKGYYKTCGNEKCLKSQYLDPNVNIKKRFKGEAICIKCGKKYKAESARQKWCKECAPNKSARRILQRYGISDLEYKALLKDAPICPICEKRKATVVDHCHSKGHVRGIICHHCNTALNLVEDKKALYRAIKYLNNQLKI